MTNDPNDAKSVEREADALPGLRFTTLGERLPPRKPQPPPPADLPPQK